MAKKRHGDLGAEDTASNVDEQRDSASNTEQKTVQDLSPDQTPDVRVLLYCFKPPFPSSGGYAAASAGRERSSPFMLTDLARDDAHRWRRFKAHPGRPLDGRPEPL